jgi:hypothetical protein
MESIEYMQLFKAVLPAFIPVGASAGACKWQCHASCALERELRAAAHSEQYTHISKDIRASPLSFQLSPLCLPSIITKKQNKKTHG